MTIYESIGMCYVIFITFLGTFALIVLARIGFIQAVKPEYRPQPKPKMEATKRSFANMYSPPQEIADSIKARDRATAPDRVVGYQVGD